MEGAPPGFSMPPAPVIDSVESEVLSDLADVFDSNWVDFEVGFLMSNPFNQSDVEQALSGDEEKMEWLERELIGRALDIYPRVAPDDYGDLVSELPLSVLERIDDPAVSLLGFDDLEFDDLPESSDGNWEVSTSDGELLLVPVPQDLLLKSFSDACDNTDWISAPRKTEFGMSDTPISNEYDPESGRGKIVLPYSMTEDSEWHYRLSDVGSCQRALSGAREEVDGLIRSASIETIGMQRTIDELTNSWSEKDFESYHGAFVDEDESVEITDKARAAFHNGSFNHLRFATPSNENESGQVLVSFEDGTFRAMCLPEWTWDRVYYADDFANDTTEFGEEK